MTTTARLTERRQNLTPKQRAYVKSLDDIARRLGHLDDQTVRRLVAHLQAVRKEIAASLVGIDPERFQAFQLKALKSNLADILNRFEASLGAETRALFGQIYEAGGRMAIDPLTAAGVEGVFFQPSTAQLNVILDFTADLIQDITGDMRGRIEAQVTRSLLGQQSPFKTMKSITDMLGVKSRDGVWGRRRRPNVVKGVAARAEAILRTETTRAANIAHHGQQLLAAQQTPGLRKRWMATGDSRTRRSHLVAHAATFSDPIPIDEPFDVGGFKLMYPGDPAGPPGETINCRCRVVTVHPDIGPMETTTDTALKAEVKKRRG